MTLTLEQLDFQESVRGFCARECGTREQRTALLDADEEDQSSVLYKKLAELGWLGVAIPEEYGGSGGTYVEQTILFEELWRGLAPVKALGPTTTVAGCYKRFGSEDQKRDALSAIANGEIMSISISEPGAGSDIAATPAGLTRSVTVMCSPGRRRGAPMRTAPGESCWSPARAGMASPTPA